MTTLSNHANQNMNKFGIFAALSCVAATGIGFGLSLPLLSFLMKEMGHSPLVIGLNTAMPAVAAFLLSPLFVRLMEKYGLKAFISLCIFLAVICFWGFYLSQNIIIWFVLRFVFGASLDGIFVACETWIAELSPDDLRGRIMGIFSSFLSIGYFLGAGILALTGSKGLLPFAMGSAFLLAVCIPLYIAKQSIPNVKSDEKTLLKPIVFSTPIAMGAAVVYGYLETSAFNLLPLYGVYNQLTEKVSISLLVAVGIGQACLQYFIGLIADKFGEKTSLSVCIATGILGALGIGLFINYPYALYPILFFWGACISGFYTLSLIIVGKKYRGNSLAGANSAVVAMFGIGSLFGPPIVGMSMEISERNGFFIAMAIPVGIYGIQLFRNSDQHTKEQV